VSTFKFLAYASGLGFDVVLSDCLAVHRKPRLPAATQLALLRCLAAVLCNAGAETVPERAPAAGNGWQRRQYANGAVGDQWGGLAGGLPSLVASHSPLCQV
jgi:hypothetical protein